MVEDDFIMIYTDVFNQPLPLAETFFGGGGAQSFPPASPSIDRTLLTSI